MHVRPVLLATLLPLACRSAVVPTPQPPPKVEIWGSLRAVMHETKPPGVVSLAEVVPGPHACALGALSELRGEITILDDEIWLARADGRGGIRTIRTRASDEQAALLVLSRVPRWREVAIARDTTLEELERLVPELAAKAGLDVEEPFPFLIVGTFREVHGHVIDGSRLPPGGGDHLDHIQAGHPVDAIDARGTILGFHSTKHAGVITHMGESLHVHVVLPEPGSTAHVDGLTVAAGAAIRFPG